jgi:hypothetical protein
VVPNPVEATAVAQSEKQGAERREHRRIPSAELPALPLVRIPNRGSISLVDLSSGGALLELPFQLQPESRITLELRTSSEQLVIPFQLLRCYVADLKNGIRYHAAGAFDQRIALRSPQDGDLRPVSYDPLLEALDVLRRASQATDLRARDTSFNELLEWTITALRRGEPANVASVKIKAHLCRLFPSLAVSTSRSFSPETPTFVRFSDLGLKSNAPLSSADRRFLKASAQLISLLGTPSAFSDLDAKGALIVRESRPHSEIVHSISDWMGISA